MRINLKGYIKCPACGIVSHKDDYGWQAGHPTEGQLEAIKVLEATFNTKVCLTCGHMSIEK